MDRWYVDGVEKENQKPNFTNYQKEVVKPVTETLYFNFAPNKSKKEPVVEVEPGKSIYEYLTTFAYVFFLYICTPVVIVAIIYFLAKEYYKY